MAPRDRHFSTTQILRFFAYDHLEEHLQAVSKPFCDLAHATVERLPDDPELTASLRKLLEAKDCAVRLAAVAVGAIR